MSLVAVSGNVSFITSIGDAGLNIPASESPFLYSILKGKEQDITSANLLGLFKGSIEKICHFLTENKSTYYCAAGLQELNNTQIVHEAVKTIVKDKGLTFICKNTIDAYTSIVTYPTSGFIISEFDPNNFKQIKEDLQDQIHFYSKNSKETRVLNETEQNSSYSQIKSVAETTQPVAETTQPTLTAYELSKYMSVRDLGTPHEFTKDEQKLVFLKNDTSPDAGRCIGMVVKMNGDNIDVMHLNCHMVNPSAIKVFRKSNETLTVKSDGKYDVTNVESNKTIMQLDTYNDEWLNYCVKRLNECIGDMLGDFDLTAENITKDTKFVLTGDLNDSDGKLIDRLCKTGIQIGQKTIKFAPPSKKLLTACPNVNSTKVAIGNTDTKKRDGFNKSLNYLKKLFLEELGELDVLKKEDKKTLDKYYLIKEDILGLVTNPANNAFEGDIALVGKFVESVELSVALPVDNGFVDGEDNKYNLNVSTKDDILKQTSDHLFVWCKTVIIPSGGRRKTRKHRKTKKKRHLKKNNKKKNTRKR